MNAINLEGFSNRDKKIIRENPDKDPHGLLMLGLSQTGYERLVERHENEKTEEIKRQEKEESKGKPNKIIGLPDADEIEIAQPIIKKIDHTPQKPPVSRLAPVKYNASRKRNVSKNGQVQVLNIKTGKTVSMSETFARKLIHGSTDNQYKII